MSSEIREGDSRGTVESKGAVVSNYTGEVLTQWGHSTGWRMQNGGAKRD